MHKNNTKKIPAAACFTCGGWTSFGGMSQHGKSDKPVMGRTGCQCGVRSARYTGTEGKVL